jgi:hypothetical protein
MPGTVWGWIFDSVGKVWRLEVNGQTVMYYNDAGSAGTFARAGFPSGLYLEDAMLVRAAAQADSAAADVPALRADFNALLAKLRAGGYLRT